mmetsp:Transcript_12523/g.22112  ORF Transcript_12523/g.22112 Transcript_12523/m.22112 type:complete len:138 (+) Transcript_12523:85-498(+)
MGCLSCGKFGSSAETPRPPPRSVLKREGETSNSETKKAVSFHPSIGDSHPEERQRESRVRRKKDKEERLSEILGMSDEELQAAIRKSKRKKRNQARVMVSKWDGEAQRATNTAADEEVKETDDEEEVSHGSTKRTSL